MQHFNSRGVPGSCSTDAGVCLRERAGSSEGIPATHNANSNTCSNKNTTQSSYGVLVSFCAPRLCSRFEQDKVMDAQAQPL